MRAPALGLSGFAVLQRHSRPIVATACSGTGCPTLALRVLSSAGQTHSDPFASSSMPIEEVAMHLAEGTFLQSDHTAFTFYTTFLPSFQSTSATNESGVLPPILDIGATHCLFPLSWLSAEHASSSKRIHLKVASGTSVRALLYNNVIYCSTVSRPLISVGQLKAVLDYVSTGMTLMQRLP